MSEPRPGPEDGARFDPARLRAARGRPPIFVAAWLIALAGVVVMGVGGRAPGEALGTPAAARPTPMRTLTPALADAIRSRAPDPIQLETARHPAAIFVHGDVYGERIVWVFVSLQNAAGRVAGWTSLSFPGAIGTFLRPGPALRFDVEVALPPDMVAETLWLQVNAHDALGEMVATTRLEIPADIPVLPLTTPSGGVP